jgi:signal transduction histidine kinase
MFVFGKSLLTRLLIYGLALVILAGSLFYSNYLASKLMERERKAVALYGNAIDVVASTTDPEADGVGIELMSFIMSNLVIENNSLVPIIITNDEGKVEEVANLDVDLENTERVQEYLEEFAELHEPIEVEYTEGKFNYVYYGQSFVVEQLRWFPAFQLLLVAVFIAGVFVSFAIAKRNEQNRVWVGLARETAHQLGTPVSSLMAWIELLKLKSEDKPEEAQLVDEMARDVTRLEIIAERFSKIGSQPELVETSLREFLDRSADYLKKRMTQRGSIQLHVNNQIPLDSVLHVNPQLFDWVIENLLKNALDAIQSQRKEGSITLNAGEKGNQYFIDVSDTGKGIAKGQFKKVFEPGFTTKKRGWGLGLSLTKRIVEDYHKGKIFVKASELGKGTTFRVLLPK